MKDRQTTFGYADSMIINLVEDEPAIVEAVAAHLEQHGFEVRTFTAAGTAEAALLEQPADLLVLDVNLVDGGAAGFDLLRRVREAGLSLPILMLTARDAVEDRVLGLNLGADDYLAKPFDLTELLARVHALLRRVAQVKQNRLERGPLTIDFASHAVSWDEATLTLTPREYALLELLARNPLRVFSPAELIDRVWHEGVENSNVVRVYVHYLRSKLGAEVVEKVSGGYRLGV